MVRRLLLGQMRVQEINHRDGRVSYTIVRPGGAVHPRADGFLVKYQGQGTDRTYAYHLVDHLRWLENEALSIEKVQFRDLERCMGATGAKVSMPFGAPWRIGKPLGSFGRCAVSVCHLWAYSPLGICHSHHSRYRSAGRPGAARIAMKRWQPRSDRGLPIPLHYDDEAAFRAWCASVPVMSRPGQLSLRGLSPLLRTEFQWCLFARSQRRDHSYWSTNWIPKLVNQCRDQGWKAMSDIDLAACNHTSRVIVHEFRADLRLVYYTTENTREAGFIETDQFGIRLTGDRGSHMDLNRVPQRWLRNVLWDSMAARLRSPQGARSGNPFDASRRAAVELGAFLAIAAPEHGEDPRLLTAEHMNAFVVDQRRRARDRLPSLGLHRYRTTDPGTCTENSRREVFNHARRMLRDALEDGTADQIRLPREFICALPTGGGPADRARSPFTDEIARALADEDNLTRLSTEYDPNARGLGDIWETLVFTGAAPTRSSSCGSTASAATADCPCSGTTRPCDTKVACE